MTTAARPREFSTTSPRGLRRELPPMRLWQKAKSLGVWDPAATDLAADERDWRRLQADEKDLLLRLTSNFLGGEESVTRELLPLIGVVATEGRMEEEMFLTAFLWEEAKHVDTFRRFLDEVAHEHGELSRYHTPTYRRIFHEELPGVMSRLHTDTSPAAQAEAAVTYNLVVEGVLAETGYHTYHATLQHNGIMPGMQTLVSLIKRDEARHMAYGVYLLSRLLAEHGDTVWQAIERRMGEMLGLSIGVVNEAFAAYEVVPFRLKPDDFVEYAMAQFQKRMERVARARGQTLEQVERSTDLGEVAD
jgi:ribonucleoside-diphosphate reductase beta chain